MKKPCRRGFETNKSVRRVKKNANSFYHEKVYEFAVVNNQNKLEKQSSMCDHCRSHGCPDAQNPTNGNKHNTKSFDKRKGRNKRQQINHSLKTMIYDYQEDSTDE